MKSQKKCSIAVVQLPANGVPKTSRHMSIVTKCEIKPNLCSKETELSTGTGKHSPCLWLAPSWFLFSVWPSASLATPTQSGSSSPFLSYEPLLAPEHQPLLLSASCRCQPQDPFGCSWMSSLDFASWEPSLATSLDLPTLSHCHSQYYYLVLFSLAVCGWGLSPESRAPRYTKHSANY